MNRRNLFGCLVVAIALPWLASAAQVQPFRWGGDKSGGGPYIVEAEDGKLSGFEVDLAAHLARELGQQPEFVHGPWDKLLDKLARKDVEVVLNGYEWSAERENIAISTIPYYVYKLQLMARVKDDSIKSWADLRARPGKPKKRVGVLTGSAAERYLEREFQNDIELKPYPDVTTVMTQVQQAQDLDATVQDVPATGYYGPSFKGLRLVDAPVEPGYYVMFLRKDDTDLRDRLNKAIEKAAADGTLERIYKQYGIWNADQEQIGKITPWPPATAPPTPFGEHFSFFAGTLTQAAGVTILLACLAMPLAIVIGLLVAVGRLYAPWYVSKPLGFYVEFLRGTPLLLQLYVIYYLLPGWGIRIPAFWAGVLGLGINYSAYEAENYRAGLLAIPKGQMEAALALGMDLWTALRVVIVPQAVRIVIPPVTNDFIALFKDTSVCSVIAVVDLTGRYNQLYNNPKYAPFVLQLGLMAAILYLLMSYPLSLLARRLEKSFSRVVA